MAPDGTVEPARAGTVVYLNGTSSSGKTTLARQLQKTLPGPWLHLEADRFFAALSRHAPWTVQPMVGAIHACAAAAAAGGLNAVVDGLLLTRTWLKDAVDRLADQRAFLIAVRCPPGELARRERARGDRRPGQARDQLGLVHAHGVYDLEVDTARATLAECAAAVTARLADPAPPEALRRLRGSGYLRDETAYGWVLLRRSRGPGVERLQTDLRRLGHDPGPTDGVFGPRTEAAVRAFQAARGIPTDGALGPPTIRALMRALSGDPPGRAAH